MFRFIQEQLCPFNQITEIIYEEISVRGGRQFRKLMTLKPKVKLFVAFLALALAGCVSTPFMPDASISHPANQQAAQSDYPPPQPGLLSITNMVEVKSVTEPVPEDQQGHEGHDPKPKAEEKK